MQCTCCMILCDLCHVVCSSVLWTVLCRVLQSYLVFEEQHYVFYLLYLFQFFVFCLEVIVCLYSTSESVHSVLLCSLQDLLQLFVEIIEFIFQLLHCLTLFFTFLSALL